MKLTKKIVIIILVFLLLTPFVIYLSEKKAISQGPEKSYVGVEKCKLCHAKRYDDFQDRKFSKAWRILEMRNETTNPECLKCHTTGYGKPSGFIDADTTPHLKFKQCEACHGPASAHVEDPGNAEEQKALIDYVKDKDTCIQCHICVTTHGSSKDF